MKTRDSIQIENEVLAQVVEADVKRRTKNSNLYRVHNNIYSLLSTSFLINFYSANHATPRAKFYGVPAEEATHVAGTYMYRMNEPKEGRIRYCKENSFFAKVNRWIFNLPEEQEACKDEIYKQYNKCMLKG